MINHGVGEVFRNGEFYAREGVWFNVTSEGADLIISYPNPQKIEKKELRKGNLKMGFYSQDDALFFLFKFGTLHWKDAPYSIHLTTEEDKLKGFDEQKGLPMFIYFVDTNTGKLVQMRLISLPNNLSNSIVDAINHQKDMNFNHQRYHDLIESIKQRNSPDDLAGKAEVMCMIKAR